MAPAARDDFSQQTKAVLARRAGMRCSNPTCRRPTAGPAADPARAVNMGKAAHITAASPGGPRYDPALTREERSSIDNGIWLCAWCADLVDRDETRFTAELLRQWKKEAEERAAVELQSPWGAAREGDGTIAGIEPLEKRLAGPSRDAGGPRLFRAGGPVWADFEAGVVYRRSSIDAALQLLAGGREASVVVLSGASAAGKSVAASYTGYVLRAHHERTVLWADTEGLVRRTGGTVLGALNAVRGIAAPQGTERPVVIIEDLHRLGDRDAIAFLEEVDRAHLDVDWIVTSRPIPDPQDRDVDLLARTTEDMAAAALVNVTTNAAGGPEFAGLACHLWRERWRLDPLRPGAPPPFELSERHLQELGARSAGNLWVLTWIIQAHEGDPGQPFSGHAAGVEIAAYLEGREGYPSLSARCGLRTALNSLQVDVPTALVCATSLFSRWDIPVDCDFLCDLLSSDPGLMYAFAQDLLSGLVDGGEIALVIAGPEGVPCARLHASLAQAYYRSAQQYGRSGAVRRLCGAASARLRRGGATAARAPSRPSRTPPDLAALLWAAYILWSSDSGSSCTLTELARQSLPLVVRWPVSLHVPYGVEALVPYVYVRGLPAPSSPVERNLLVCPQGPTLFRSDSPLRGGSAAALAQLVSACPAVGDALAEGADHMLRGGDELAAAGACCLLTLRGPSSAGPLARLLLEHTSAQVRFASAVHLQAMLHDLRGRAVARPAIAGALRAALRDPEPGVRAACARGLTFVPGRDTCEALTTCLVSDADEWPRCEAAISLANLHCAEATPVLEALARDTSLPSLWFTADAALDALRSGREIRLPAQLADVMPRASSV